MILILHEAVCGYGWAIAVSLMACAVAFKRPVVLAWEACLP
jgi:hypothetical protein